MWSLSWFTPALHCAALHCTIAQYHSTDSQEEQPISAELPSRELTTVFPGDPAADPPDPFEILPPQSPVAASAASSSNRHHEGGSPLFESTDKRPVVPADDSTHTSSPLLHGYPEKESTLSELELHVIRKHSSQGPRRFSSTTAVKNTIADEVLASHKTKSGAAKTGTIRSLDILHRKHAANPSHPSMKQSGSTVYVLIMHAPTRSR